MNEFTNITKEVNNESPALYINHGLGCLPAYQVL